jgi:DNA-directed RNA polymerase II subunit RPB2
VAFTSQQECLVFLGRCLEQVRNSSIDDDTAQHYARQNLMEKLLPHIGTKDIELRKKAYYVGYMARRLIAAFLGITGEDDRDHYGKKRIDLTGALMLNLFIDLFRNQYLENAKRLLKRLLQSGREGT